MKAEFIVLNPIQVAKLKFRLKADEIIIKGLTATTIVSSLVICLQDLKIKDLESKAVKAYEAKEN